MIAEANERAPHETGGILVGYEVAQESAVVITHLVGAGPSASYSRSEFVPDGRWQERHVAAIYEASGRLATYLGDWHSHPDGYLSPSRKDHRTARAIARYAAARARRPLMLIVASEAESWSVAAFRLRRRKLRAMQIRSYDDGGDEFAGSLDPQDA
jgi:integrative and conjugative element protein (TIGR02256 family)